MKTEDRITDFNLSEKLKSIGFPQKDQDKYDHNTGKRISDNGLYYWYKHEGSWKLGTYSKCSEHTHKCRALTTDELWDFLPKTIYYELVEYYLHIIVQKDFYGNMFYSAEYITKNYNIVFNKRVDKKLANALAKLVIYLLEEGLIK